MTWVRIPNGKYHYFLYFYKMKPSFGKYLFESIIILIHCNYLQIDGRERDFLRLSKRGVLRLSKKSSMNPDYSDDMEYEDEPMPEIKLTKKGVLRLSKKSLFQDPRPLHMSQRSLRLSKRSPGMDQPMVIRLSKRQIGQLLQIKRGGLSKSLLCSSFLILNYIFHSTWPPTVEEIRPISVRKPLQSPLRVLTCSLVSNY